VKNNIFNNKFLATLVILIVVVVVVSVTTQPQVLLAPYEQSYTKELDIGKIDSTGHPGIKISGEYTVSKDIKDALFAKDWGIKKGYYLASKSSLSAAEIYLYVAYLGTECPDLAEVSNKYNVESPDLGLVSNELIDVISKCDNLDYNEKKLASKFILENTALKKGEWLSTLITCSGAVAGGGWYWVPCGVAICDWVWG
jgi:hypothetical protein